MNCSGDNKINNSICDIYCSEILSGHYVPFFRNYYFYEFKNGFSMSSHSHSSAEVMYIKKGTCSISVNDEILCLKSGDFILINGSVSHSLNVSKHVSCKVLCLEFDFVKNNDIVPDISYYFKNIRHVRLFLNSSQCYALMHDETDIFTCLYELYSELEKCEPGRDTLVNLLFGQVFIKISRLHAEKINSVFDSSQSYIRKAISFMFRNYNEQICIEDIASHVGLNVSYFHKIFKKHTSITPAEYLNSIRINKAKHLLENTNLSILDICELTGFNSSQYFSFVFKKNTNLSPTQYRIMHFNNSLIKSSNKSCWPREED